jgi:hypothetical protein
MVESRVVRLRAAAVQLVARRLLGLRVPAPDAAAMAAHADLPAIVAMLRDRLTIKRGPQPLASDQAFQHSLAVGEVCLLLVNPGPEGIEKSSLLVQEAITARLNHSATTKRMMDDAYQMEELVERLSAAGWEFRRFARDARRLFEAQRLQLVQGVRDPTTRDRAFRELHDLYSRFFDEALMTLHDLGP